MNAYFPVYVHFVCNWQLGLSSGPDQILRIFKYIFAPFLMIIKGSALSCGTGLGGLWVRGGKPQQGPPPPTCVW